MRDLYISISVDATESQDALVQSAMRALYPSHGIAEVWGSGGADRGDTVYFRNEEDVLIPVVSDDDEWRDINEIMSAARQCFEAQANDPDLFNSLIMSANYLHSWPLYALSLMAAGLPATEIFDKVVAELRDNEPMHQARPGYGHSTGTGRTSWKCHDGKIEIEISRPSGVVLAAVVDTTTFDYGTESFLVVVEPTSYYNAFLPRHLDALYCAVRPFGILPNKIALTEMANLSQKCEIRHALEKLKREIEELHSGCDFATLDAAVVQLTH